LSMFGSATRRLQRRCTTSVDDMDHKAAQGAGRLAGSGVRVVVVGGGQRREVDGQVESLTAAGAHRPRAGDGAGDQFRWTDLRHE